MQRQQTCIDNPDNNYILDEIKRRDCIEHERQIQNDDK